ncbi:MAG TPA: hypothetical protein ENI23_02030 [bacterium]|nr:hypothetical protein [bacterium]
MKDEIVDIRMDMGRLETQMKARQIETLNLRGEIMNLTKLVLDKTSASKTECSEKLKRLEEFLGVEYITIRHPYYQKKSGKKE